jgi:hypothetical protein
LQKGVWRGVRILPEAWVEAATNTQVANPNEPNIDWRQGYGYQFWRCRHGAYRGDGAFGQFCIIMPEQDAVLAITSGVGNMQAVLELAWQHLLPAMQADPLPEDARAQQTLDQKLARLALPAQPGRPSSPIAPEVSGRAYRFENSDQDVNAISLGFDGPFATLTMRDSCGTHQVAVGSGTWHTGTTTLWGGTSRPVAASGVWTSDDVYVVQLCFYETPFCSTLTFRFEGDQLVEEWKDNVAFGPTERPQIVGTAE